MITDDGVTKVVLNIGLFCTVSYDLEKMKDGEHRGQWKQTAVEVVFKGQKVPGVDYVIFGNAYCPNPEWSLPRPIAHFVFKLKPTEDLNTDFLTFLKKEGMTYFITPPGSTRW